LRAIVPSGGGRIVAGQMNELRQLQAGTELATALLLTEVQARVRRDGSEMLRLKLADRTATVDAIVLDRVDEARDACQPGTVVFVCGTYDADERFGTRVVISSIRPAAEDEYEHHELVDGPARSIEILESDLRELEATIQNRYLRALLAALLGPATETWTWFREAPAAKRYHQAYRHGLLEHSLTVAQAVSAISATFGGIDRDVAVTGALLHDIGKLDAYEIVGDAIEMTDRGRLYGEISLGYYRVRQATEAIDGFPEELAQALAHIILSHHGSLQHGSPVVPCTREATLVHMADNFGARMGSFDRLQKSLPAGEEWSAFDKGLGAGAFFPMPSAPLDAQRRAA
jgi:3'-5' exoribonuclease